MGKIGPTFSADFEAEAAGAAGRGGGAAEVETVATAGLSTAMLSSAAAVADFPTLTGLPIFSDG